MDNEQSGLPEDIITYYVNLPDTSAMDSTCCFEKGLNLERAVISACCQVNSLKHSLVQQDSPSRDRVTVVPWRGVVDRSDVYGNHVGRSHRHHYRDRQVVDISSVYQQVTPIRDWRQQTRQSH